MNDKNNHTAFLQDAYDRSRDAFERADEIIAHARAQNRIELAKLLASSTEHVRNGKALDITTKQDLAEMMRKEDMSGYDKQPHDELTKDVSALDGYLRGFNPNRKLDS